MKYLLSCCFLLFFGGVAIAQSYEGRLVYREMVGSTERQVTLFVAPQQVLIKRGEEKALFYLIHATERGFSAWQGGASKADQGTFKPTAKPAKMLPAKGKEQIISGFKAQSLRYELADGSIFEGWYTTDLPFQHNAFVNRLLGNEWGWLPANGILLRWQVSNSKGGSQMAGELVSHQAGKQDPKLFAPPVTTDR